MKFSLREWIKNNRKEIDSYLIEKMGPKCFTLNDEDRRVWVLNDESLYNWAKREAKGV